MIQNNNQSNEKENNILTVTKISLLNFGSYENGTIECNNNLIIIHGQENGSGKSTFAEAISRIFTSNYIMNIKDEDKIRHGSLKFQIIIEGIYNGKKIQIVCEKGKTYKIQILHDSKTYNGKEAEEFLSNIITYDEFLRLTYITGKDIDILIQGTPEIRGKVLDRILGIQSLLLLIDNLKTKSYSDTLALLEEQLKQKRNEKKLISNIITNIININDLKNELEQKKLQYKTISDELIQLKDKYDQLLLKKNEYEKIIQEKNNIETKIIQLQSRYQQISSEKEQKTKEYEIIITELQNILKSNTISDDLIRITLSNHNNTLEHINSVLTSIQSDEYSSAIILLQKEIIHKNNNICNVCNSSIDESKKKYIIENIQNISSNKIKKITVLKKKRIILMEEIKKIETLNQNRINISSLLSKYDTQLTNIQNDITVQNNKLNTIIYNWNEKEFESLKIEKGIKENLLTELQYQIYNLENKIKQNEIYTEQNDIFSILENEINIIEKNKKLCDYKLSKIQKYKNGLKNILVNIRNKILEEINPLIQQWINALLNFTPTNSNIPPPLSYELVVTEKITEKMYNIRYEDKVKRNGIPISFYNLSTGQRAICALSLIFALKEISSSYLDLLIFDELSTSGIDDQKLNKILEIIVKLSTKIKILFLERRKDIITYLKKIAEKYNIPYTHYNVNMINNISHISMDLT